MVKVTVKWNKAVFSDVEVDLSLGVQGFKAKIRELTNVPEARQKLMAKGCWSGTLKEDFNLSSCTLDNAQIMLMGTADAPSAPAPVTTFLEDLTPDEIAQKGVALPVGLVNLGNTCYLNSTVQCLKSLPELRPLLSSRGGLHSVLASVLEELGRSGTSVAPHAFIRDLRTAYPQFAELQQGRYMQQDADELLNAVLAGLDLRGVLSLDIDETLTCKESSDEPVVVHKDVINKLVCNIQGGVGATVQVDHLLEGLKLSFESMLEKRSDVLGRDAVWTKTQRISSLPKFLCVQFMRFFWKATPESRDHAGVKCKIMRPVKFPETLDLYDLCNPVLQQTLLKNRQDAARAMDERLAKVRGDDQAMDVDDQDLQAALALSLSSEVGLYALHAMVTHKGRSADSGHYKAYVRAEVGSDVWRCFDDDKVSISSTEEVLRLHGNGDSDMAYLCFFTRKEAKR